MTDMCESPQTQDMAPPLCVEDIADALSIIIGLARAEYDPRDETQCELVEALTVAWLAAERWRLERSPDAMVELNRH